MQAPGSPSWGAEISQSKNHTCPQAEDAVAPPLEGCKWSIFREGERRFITRCRHSADSKCVLYRRIHSACGTQEHAGIWGTSVQFCTDKFDTRIVENHCIIELSNVVRGLLLADVDVSLLQPIIKKSSV